MSSENLKAHQHKRDADRKDLAGEHPLGDIVQVIFIILFLAVWILDSFVLKYSTFLSESISWYVRGIAGAVILILSLLMARSGMKIVFSEVRDTPHVITKGVFSLVRHPIYLAAILSYMGLIFITLSIITTGLWLLIIIFYHFISSYEEKLLINMYGDDYREYRKKVPMLFPVKFRPS
ncbi:MAG TPA: isoprenylcysteine carboxylmethyltransferase family protein [Bacteroides sp.]|nr:isoprenylcysteine carboxylmethyltransferase family protein [Bacteroides sp.]